MAEFIPNYRELCDQAYEIFEKIFNAGIPLPKDIAEEIVFFNTDYLGEEVGEEDDEEEPEADGSS